jgi:hypothetical protein
LHEYRCQTAIHLDALEAMHDLRRRPVQLAVAETSMRGLEPIEFCFNVYDLPAPRPVVVLGGEHINTGALRLEPMCVTSVQDPMEVERLLPDAVELAQRLRYV